jgi:hypothetical protein
MDGNLRPFGLVSRTDEEVDDLDGSGRRRLRALAALALGVGLAGAAAAACAGGSGIAMGSGKGRSRRPGSPGHWPQGVVWIASAGGKAAWLGYHLERLDLKVPPGSVPSPDGRSIAWIDRHGAGGGEGAIAPFGRGASERRAAVRVGPLPEGPWRTVWESRGAATPGELRWPAAGGRIIVSTHAERTTWHVVDPEGRAPAVSVEAADLDVAPDGLSAAAGGGSVLQIVPILGTDAARTQAVHDHGSPSFTKVRFSPDGRFVAAIESWPGPDGPAEHVLQVVEVATGGCRLIAPHASPDRAPEWSPDGTEVAFLDGSGRLAAVHVASRRRVVLVERDRSGPVVGPFAWTPDGSAVVYAMNRPAGESKRSAESHDSELLAVDVGEPASWGLGTGRADVLVVLPLAGIPGR